MFVANYDISTCQRVFDRAVIVILIVFLVFQSLGKGKLGKMIFLVNIDGEEYLNTL
jgi:hypothetical protein